MPAQAANRRFGRDLAPFVNKEVQNELKKNEAEYKIIEEIIMARQEKSLTQKELAELVGTGQ